MTSIASGSKVLHASEADMQKMLAAHVHLGTKNVNEQTQRYIYARTKDGVHVFNLHMTWEKLILAARVVVAIENPMDIFACSLRQFGQRAVLKFAQNVGTQYSAGRFIPGSFTNQIQAKFQQPRLLIVTDPRTDHQALNEARLANIPVIAFCDTDSPLQYVDIAIPCNNRGRHAIGMMYWLLAREVLRMRGTQARSVPWTVQVDLFFYRDPDEVLKKDDQKAVGAGKERAEGMQWADQNDNWEANN
jgi:small subunit ribosomal protein SAe